MNKAITIKDIYLFLVIIFSGSAIPLFRDAIGLVLLFVLGVFVFYKEIAKTDKRVIYACLIWILFSIVQIYSVGKVNIFIWFTYCSKILIGYWVFSYFKLRLLNKYVDILYYLSCVSLFFFVWQLLNYGSLDYILGLIDIGGSFNAKNILIYNLYDNPTFRMIRASNCGFCYEPGPFGGFLTIAIAFLLFNRDEFSNYKRYLFIFVLTLITTQSSSAYICGLVLLVWFTWNKIKTPAVRFVSFFLMIAFVLFLFMEVPVLRDKILVEFTGLERYDTVIAEYRQSKNLETLSLGRFVSWQFDYATFLNYPIFGMAPNPELHQLYRLTGDASISAINGLGKIIAFYGSFGAFFFLYSLIRSGMIYQYIYRFRGVWIFPLIILFQGFAFSIIETPFYVTLWLIPFIIKNKLLK